MLLYIDRFMHEYMHIHFLLDASVYTYRKCMPIIYVYNTYNPTRRRNIRIIHEFELEICLI